MDYRLNNKSKITELPKKLPLYVGDPDGVLGSQAWPFGSVPANG